MTQVYSITQSGLYEPFDVQVARGAVAWHSTVNIYGAQTAVGVSTIPIWENATAYTYPVAATLMNLVSTVAGDVGMTILINGLDAGYNQISETVTLNGTTVVPTVSSFFRINGMFVASGAPTGVITLKNLANTVTYSQIAANFGRSQAAIYTVPAGYTFLLSRVDAYSSTNGFTADYIVYRNQTISSAGVTTFTQQAPFTGNYNARRVMPRPFLEKTDIQLQARASANSYYVSIAAEGYLVKNDSST